MRDSNYSHKLLVTPLLSLEQIGGASVDIRLGSSIIIPRMGYIEKQDVTDQAPTREGEYRIYERRRLRYHARFILQPSQLILAATFEYLSLPPDLFCTVSGLSSWGRLGLVVARAGAVPPGHKGCLTLELSNHSQSPIVLYPGLSVGQLVFQEVVAAEGEELVRYEGRYECPTEAELPRFFARDADDELMFWGESPWPEMER